MHDFKTHTRHLADLETSVRDARQRNIAMPKVPVGVISVLVALVIAGTMIGSGGA